ncbi:outer membrane efflux protein [Paludibacter propionicigenes WB4]|uniref:Outer membrane efflux protein n=1 Tax=Paludibacter propionicigenes (strain DSM 17365 / JCM 13257 / WB4) TaxID=694427 RepID=E4T143_PALPW|nr:TolC family protein [Paludibacter propionicigenes]ADQ78424.1 outer membrane efflux protein [Paludibacter propionicigenes WB4]
MKSIIKLTVILLLLPALVAHGQSASKISGDSLSLSQILNEVIYNYPSIKKAQSDIESSDARIGLAKTAYLPDVNLAGSFALLGPTTSLTMPGLGSFHLYPPDSYSAAINISQTIYDFGKTDKNIAFAKQNKELVGLSVDQLKQKLSGMLVGNYYSIVFVQEALKIKEEELNTLNVHLQFVQKKAATGSATNYEILTTKVRISTIENQKTDLLNTLQIQLSQLNSFLGKQQDTKLTVKKSLLSPQIIAANDSLYNFAINHRSEMKIARQKNILTDTHLKIVNAQNNPTLNFNGTGGIKNGYFNNKYQDVGKLNYVVGIGLKVPIFDANRTKYNRIQAQSEIKSNLQDTELTRRAIINEVIESKSNTETALKKVNQSELQLEQAEQAYSLADTNFKAGVITNLDLLDSSTAVAESKLALLKTKIEYSINFLKLKIALGEQIY